MGDDDRKLFEQALAELSADDVFRGKYGAPEDAERRRHDDEQTAEDRKDEGADYRAVQRLRDDRMMLQAFTGVQRLDASKYHVAAPKQAEAADGNTLREGTSAKGDKPREGTSAKGDKPREGTSAKGDKLREGTSAKGDKPREGTSAKGDK